MGFAHHSNYLNYFEMARIEWLNKIGFSYKELEGQGIAMPVVSANIKFKSPAFFDDLLRIKLTLKEIPKSTIKINYKIIENAFFKENKNQKTKEISREFNIIKFANENTNLFIENCKFIEFNDKEIAENEDLIFLISPGMITLNQIILINKYIKIYPNKFIGWLFLNQEKFFKN